MKLTDNSPHYRPRLLLMTLALSWILLPSDVHAQLRMEDLTFRFAAGPAVPVTPSEFTDGYDLGISTEAGLGLAVSPPLRLVLSGTYARFPTDSEGFATDPLNPSATLDPSDLTGGDVGVLAGGLDLQYAFVSAQQITPYLVSGLRVVHVDREAVRGPASQTATDPVSLRSASQVAYGTNFGLGLRIPVSYTAAFFAEARYAITFTDPERLHAAPIRAGLVFGEF